MCFPNISTFQIVQEGFKGLCPPSRGPPNSLGWPHLPGTWPWPQEMLSLSTESHPPHQPTCRKKASLCMQENGTDLEKFTYCKGRNRKGLWEEWDR